jgi:hypothetical protein
LVSSRPSNVSSLKSTASRITSTFYWGFGQPSRSQISFD